jgi:uncharacterized heparinase superfamily protein
MDKLESTYQILKRYHFYGILPVILKITARKLCQLQLKGMAKSKNYYHKYLLTGDMQSLDKKIQNMPPLPLTRDIHEIKKRNLYKSEIQIILQEADYICENTFNILGSGWIRWTDDDNNIDWHMDMKTKFRWDRNCYFTEMSKWIRKNLKTKNPETISSNQPYIAPPLSLPPEADYHPAEVYNPDVVPMRDSIEREGKGGIDAKIPRELSRFYFLFPLLFASVYTGNDKYQNKIKYLIHNWIDKNPPFYGVNWSNAMEAAIRLMNWCFIIHALKSSLLADKKFSGLFIRSVTEHIVFIIHNLENIVLKNNHYLANIAGIYTANLLFPVLKKSKRYLRWSAKELKEELAKRIHKDGGNCENSTAYQRLILELFFLPFYLAQQFQTCDFPSDSDEKLENMFRFSLHILKPNGKIIQFGDNDSGSLFQLYHRESLDHAYLLSLGFGLVKNETFCIKEFPFDIIAYILYGHRVYHDYQTKMKSLASLPSHTLPYSGIYIFRNMDYYLAISCMPNNREGKNIHTHNDKLSFELAYKNHDIVVDPGTYVYGSDHFLRNLYRSTSSHNTVYQNNQLEQNRLGRSIFNLYNDAAVKINHYNLTCLDCQHNGFIKQGGNIHRRKFNMDDSFIRIEDYIESDGTSTCSLHFAPDVKVRYQGANMIIQIQDKNLLSLEIQKAIKIKKEKYDYSPGYGELQPAEKLIIFFKKELYTIFSIINGK